MKCIRTLRFLHGPDYTSPSEPDLQSDDGQQDDNEEEEELDEDDLEEDVEKVKRSGGAQVRPSAPAPDYETPRREAQTQEVRVGGFHGAVCVLPEEVHAEPTEEKTPTEVSKHNPRCLDSLAEIYFKT